MAVGIALMLVAGLLLWVALVMGGCVILAAVLR